MARKSRVFENVTVIDIGDKGHAIGKTPEGRVVLVEGAVPGDVVTVQTRRKRKGMFITCPIEFHKYSEFRANPFCRHFGVCGGCKWQNLQYEKQAELKEKAVRDALGRIAHISDPEVLPILTGVDQTHYRNKLEFTFTDHSWLTQEEIDSGREIDRRGLGFHVPGEFSRVVDIHECYLQPEPSNSIKNHVRKLAVEHQYGFQNIRSRDGLLRNLLVRNNSNNEFLVALILTKEDLSVIDIVLGSLRENFPQIRSLYYAVNDKVNDSIYDLDFKLYFGEEKLNETLANLTFEIGPKSFFQTNRAQAEALYRAAIDMAGLDGSQLVFDLYCGIGSITLYAAQNARFAVGVEENEAAVIDAGANASANNISNVEFFAGDAKDVLQQEHIRKLGKPQVVITDPPRAGMHESVVRSILEMDPGKIVYVSCNPSTQARDIALLSERYSFIKAQPVDMFPQTSHIENVALLTRKN